MSIEPVHVTRYLDEQAFRFNNRYEDDGGRFVRLLKDIVGRRLTYPTSLVARWKNNPHERYERSWPYLRRGPHPKDVKADEPARSLENLEALVTRVLEKTRGGPKAKDPG